MSPPGAAEAFSTACTRCPRLAAHLALVRSRHPDYHARPVASFGDPDARFLIVGLAPGMHGANATGRPFTGDHAGVILYETLHEFGFGSAPASRSADDGLELRNCRISNAVRCLPPANKPLPAEVRNCNPYLADELRNLPANSIVLALGRIAHEAVLLALDLKKTAFAFAHGAWHEPPVAGMPGLVLADSYHCSRYNTQTRRLTAAMFREVFTRVRERLGPEAADGGRPSAR